MATYYKWSKNTFQTQTDQINKGRRLDGVGSREAIVGSTISVNNDGTITVNGNNRGQDDGGYIRIMNNAPYAKLDNGDVYYFPNGGRVYMSYLVADTPYSLYLITGSVVKGTFIEYVYSTSSSKYPNNGISGSYYYDQRTTVTSPTNPSQISYPSTINSLSATITWQPATSNTSYPVSRYELSYSTNGGSSWQVAGTTTQTSYTFGIFSPEVTQIQFRVRAMDTNSQDSGYVTGEISSVAYTPANPPVLVLPDNAKLGNTITISWNSVTDATNYILQRKVDGGEWTQIYSGAELSTTNLVDNLGISYRIAFNVGSNFTSEWSQEYRLNTYEKLIEMTYLSDDGNYMPLYPRTISNAVVNASDLINTVSLSGTYQGTGIESNTVLLNVKEGIEPKIAFVSDNEGNVEVVNSFDSKGNLVVDNNSNVAGEEYSYVVIGKKEY